MTALLGLAAATCYGAADFLGGWASRRGGALPVVLWSQVAGLVVLLVALAPLAGGPPPSAALVWGGAAGATVAGGLVVYFRGLARARMGVVTPITAVVTAAVPVCVGLAAGERPSLLAVAGVLLAVGAVALVSLASDTADPPVPGPLAGAGGAVPAGAGGAPAGSGSGWLSEVIPPGVADAVVAGAAFGLYFVFMGRTGPGAAVWPLLAANVASLGVLGAAVVVTGRAWRLPRSSTAAVVAAGVLGTAASLAFLLAVRQGLLSLVSVLASLSPAVTVGLARLFLGEQLSRAQLAGLGVAVAGVGLIAAG